MPHRHHILTPLIHFLFGAQDREVDILRLNILESTFPKIQDINFPKLLELFHLDLEMYVGQHTSLNPDLDFAELWLSW